MKEPYIELYKKLDGFKVYIVDGDFIRTEKDIDFTNFGQHYRHKYIPQNELWLDSTNPQGEDEYKYYVQHMLIEHSLMSHGISYNKASDIQPFSFLLFTIFHVILSDLLALLLRDCSSGCGCFATVLKTVERLVPNLSAISFVACPSMYIFSIDSVNCVI